MAKTNKQQSSFRAGQISPRLEMQDDLKGRSQGVEVLQNWDVHLQGSVETSHGAGFIAEAGDANARIFPLAITPYTTLSAVASIGKLKIYDAGGILAQGNLIVDPYFRFGTDEWVSDTSGSGYVSSVYGAVRIVRKNTGYARVYQDYSIKGSTTGTYRFTVRIVSITGVGSIAVGSSSGGIDLYVHHFTHAGVVSFDLYIDSESTLSVTIQAVGESSVVVASVQMHDVEAGETFADFDTTWDAGSFDSMRYVDDPLLSDATPWASQILITCRNTPMYYARYSETLFGCDVGLQTITNPPSAWGANDYPNSIEFYGGRLWLGGCLSAPNTFWASKSGSTYDFDLGTASDGDAIEAIIDDGGLIEWIKGAQGRGLLIGTSKAEHSIYASGGVITPSDIATALQSTHGATTANALEVGVRLAFITPDQRKIRLTEYDYDSDVWASMDLTYPSEDITKDDGQIKRMSYAANPNSRIVGLTVGGSLTQITYDAVSGDAGFSERISQGRIIDVAALPFDGSDELWIIVDRGVDSPYYCLERIRQSRNIKLDSYVVFNADVNSSGTPTPISGGTALHLANIECQVLVDGAVHPDVTPNSLGVFETEYSGGEIIIGMAIDSVLVTLPIADTASYVGTTRPMKKRFTDIWLKILSSWRPKINGRRPPNRFVTTPMGEVEPARTESIRVSNEGWGQDATITIEQDLPVPTEISGWFGGIQQEEI